MNSMFDFDDQCELTSSMENGRFCYFCFSGFFYFMLTNYELYYFKKYINIYFSFKDSQGVDAEFLITRAAISEMCSETAKLKSMKVLSKVSTRFSSSCTADTVVGQA